MQFGLSFVAVETISWDRISFHPHFSDLWSQDEVSEDIDQVWQGMIQSIYKRKGGEDLRL